MAVNIISSSHNISLFFFLLPSILYPSPLPWLSSLCVLFDIDVSFVFRNDTYTHGKERERECLPLNNGSIQHNSLISGCVWDKQIDLWLLNFKEIDLPFLFFRSEISLFFFFSYFFSNSALFLFNYYTIFRIPLPTYLDLNPPKDIFFHPAFQAFSKLPSKFKFLNYSLSVLFLNIFQLGLQWDGPS